LEVQQEIPCLKLAYNSSGVTYVVVQRVGEGYPTGSFSCALKFLVKEVDSNGEPDDSSGYEDEYQLEDIELTTSDYMRLRVVGSFKEEWEKMGSEAAELTEIYTLNTIKTLPEAVKAIIDFVGMQPAERSNEVPPKHPKHALLLAGTFMGNIPVLVRSRMKLADGGGVNMELTVRSKDEAVNDAIINAI